MRALRRFVFALSPLAAMATGCPDAERTAYTPPPADAAVADVAIEDAGAETGDAGEAFSFIVLGDWNGDLTSTPATYEARTGRWTLIDVNQPTTAEKSFTRGGPGLVPIAGDFNGDGITSTGTYDPVTHTWNLSHRNQEGFGVDETFVWGEPGLPVVGDWDGNRSMTPGFYDPTTHVWRLSNKRKAPSVDLQFELGAPGVIPVVGDWNGDRIDTAGVYDPRTQEWQLKTQNTAGGEVTRLTFGVAEALPLTFRIQGQTSKVAFFQPFTATFTYSNGLPDGGDHVFAWGRPGRYAVVGGPTLGPAPAP